MILISAYDLDSELIRESEENRYITEYVKKLIQIEDLIRILSSTTK